MKKILLIEDDAPIANSLITYLRGEGYSVLAAPTLSRARELLLQTPDIIVLDWTLPDGEGLDFLCELRRNGSQIPILMLTAKSDLVDKVLGLESGADDYLTKPFEPRELLTRLRVRLREISGRTRKTLRVAELELEMDSRRATHEGRALDLTKLEFDLLKLLMEDPGRVFTREAILNKVWGFENFPTTRTVDNHIVQLRQKTSEHLFETVRGVGYRLVEIK